MMLAAIRHRVIFNTSIKKTLPYEEQWDLCRDAMNQKMVNPSNEQNSICYIKDNWFKGWLPNLVSFEGKIREEEWSKRGREDAGPSERDFAGRE